MTDESHLPGPAPRPSFAHASEAELARILDFYEVRWEYEPDTFPIGWSLDGEVVESFSPDFYLPDLELYLELTTLKQSLVRKKNRKLRRLRELYPDVRIKLFYARDFRMLLLKFGRFALADELSGTIGQATPPRAAVVLDESVSPGAPGQADVPAPGPPGEARGAEADPHPGAPAGPATVGPEPGRTPRGRRRGRRRRAAARAGADAVGTTSATASGGTATAHAGVMIRTPGGVTSAGTRPA